MVLFASSNQSTQGAASTYLKIKSTIPNNNDRKLKQGFRQVFGTTVFGCLNHYPLEQARSLLQETNLAVAQVARKVGYSNLSAFSTAFIRRLLSDLPFAKDVVVTTPIEILEYGNLVGTIFKSALEEGKILYECQ